MALVTPHISVALSSRRSASRLERSNDVKSDGALTPFRACIVVRLGPLGSYFEAAKSTVGRLGNEQPPRAAGHAERLIGSIRRECVDHVVIFSECHLRHVLLSYVNYYNDARTHLSLNKDAPVSRATETTGRIIRRPVLGGLHHQYART